MQEPPSFVLSRSNRSTYTNKYALQSSFPTALPDVFLSSLWGLLEPIARPFQVLAIHFSN